MDKENLMKIDFKENDAVAFMWSYTGADKKELQMANITNILGNGDIVVHFLYGYKSVAEIIKPEDVIAILNPEGTPTEVKGWKCKVRKVIDEKAWKEAQI